MWKVNVTGTENIVEACYQTRVTRLIHVSSVNAVGPNIKQIPAMDLEEDMPYDPNPMTFYGHSKKEGEKVVLAANGRENNSGKVLTTCSLRPMYVYGENSRSLVQQYIRSRATRNKILAASASTTHLSCIYTGNLAWAVLTAATKLEKKKELVGGNAYFLRDDTPNQSAYRLSAQIFKEQGITLAKREPFLPFWVLYYMYAVVSLIVGLFRNLGLTKMELPNRKYMFIANTHFTVSRRKFTEDFGFVPPFSYEETIARMRRYMRIQVEREFESNFYDFKY